MLRRNPLPAFTWFPVHSSQQTCTMCVPVSPAVWVFHADSSTRSISSHPLKQHPLLIDHDHSCPHSSTPF